MSLARTSKILTIYPGVISRAVAALDESPDFRGMPDSFFRVVIRLIKKINIAMPTTPIIVPRKTLAAESGHSVETVGRALTWLDKHGFITRHQIAQPGLKGSRAPITPTPALLKALSFGQVEPRINNPQGNNRLGADTDGSRSLGLVNLQSLQETSPAAGSPAKAKSVVVGNFRLPADLSHLVVEQELEPTGLLSLMKLAKQAGQRLSDIVAVAKDWIAELKGREVYAYLLTLIKQGKDFRYLRAVAEDEAVMGAAARANEVRLAQKAIDWLGRVFATSDGAGTIAVEPGGWLRIRRPAVYGATQDSTRRIDVEFMQLVERGELRLMA